MCLVIYVRAGITIYKWRIRLNDFSNSNDYNTASQGVRTQTQTQTQIDNSEISGIAKTTNITITTSDSAPPDLESPFRPATRPEPVHTANIYTGPAAPPIANPSEQQNIRAQQLERRKRSPSDEAAITYAKTSLLFFTGMLVTWIPASANRLYVLIDGHSSTGLGYLSAFVLPLQGFWNALIYYYTSRAACKQVINSFRNGSRRLEDNDVNGSGFADRGVVANGNTESSYQLDRIRSSNRQDSFGETESTTSLTAKV
jgi:hypothetical protein